MEMRRAARGCTAACCAGEFCDQSLTWRFLPSTTRPLSAGCWCPSPLMAPFSTWLVLREELTRQNKRKKTNFKKQKEKTDMYEKFQQNLNSLSPQAPCYTYFIYLDISSKRNKKNPLTFSPLFTPLNSIFLLKVKLCRTFQVFRREDGGTHICGG